MLNIDLDTVKEYAPVAARYVATAAVGGAAIALNHFHIQLDPATTSAVTAGLTTAFAALIIFAFRNKAADRKAIVDNTVAAAVTGIVPVDVAKRATEAQAAAIDASPHATVGK